MQIIQIFSDFIMPFHLLNREFKIPVMPVLFLYCALDSPSKCVCSDKNLPDNSINHYKKSLFMARADLILVTSFVNRLSRLWMLLISFPAIS